MFPSQGVFQSAACPFYQHGLCHRPYCHFKHSKNDRKDQSTSSASSVSKDHKEHGKEVEEVDSFKNSNRVVTEESKEVANQNVIHVKETEEEEEEEEEFMKIVKNISPSKLFAYAQKRKDEKELAAKLDQIDKENQDKINLYNNSNSNELKGGLIDNFYKKETSVGNIITPLTDNNTELDDISTVLKLPSDRQICDCDDPDCDGFLDPLPDDEHSNEIIDNGNQVGDVPEEIYSDTEEKQTKKPAKRRKKKRKKLADLDFFSAQENVVNKKGKSVIDSIANLEALVSMKNKDEHDPNNYDNYDNYDDDDDHDDVRIITSNKRKLENTDNDELINNTKLKKVKQKSFLNEQKNETEIHSKSKKNSEDIEKETKKVKSKKQKDISNKEQSKVNKESIVSMKKTDAGVVDYLTDDIHVTTGQASLKKRVAHSNNEVYRGAIVKSKKITKKLSYISPALAAPLTKDAKVTSNVVETLPSMGFSTEEGVYTGKRRVAHTGSSTTKASSSTNATTGPYVRPKLPMEYNSKIPHMLRQRYLDKIMEEYIPKCESEEVGCEKGFSEEAVAFQRSSRKPIYLNLCASIIKKIRGMSNYEKQDELSPFDSGQPTVLSTKLHDQTNLALKRLQSSTIAGYQKVRTVPKKAIKPVSSNLANAKSLVSKKNSTSSSNSATNQRKVSTESLQLNEDTLYDHLSEHYLLSNGEMWENKYPQMDSDDAQLAIVKDYEPLKNPLKRVCCRCGKEYFMNAKGKYITRDECNYHWGKLRRQREKGSYSTFFSCCQVDGNGLTCSTSRLHVCHRVGELEGYVSTENWSNEENKRKVFALDCEMCYTTQGLELTRLTVVDYKLDQIVDLFIKPKNPIVDYNTRFSGVTKENLQDVSTNIDDIHDILSNLMDAKTILMGHSLESDLNALKLVHRHVVDTALVFPHRLGLPFKRALRNLMADHLQKIIQDGEGGHDSCEDARACMELMWFKFKEDIKKLSRVNHYSTMTSKSFYTKTKL